MTSVTIVVPDVDQLFMPYESRPSTTHAAEVATRRSGLDFGWEFNRLQGGVRSDISRRLGELYATGRIDDAEYVQLATELALAGVLNGIEVAVDGR